MVGSEPGGGSGGTSWYQQVEQLVVAAGPAGEAVLVGGGWEGGEWLVVCGGYDYMQQCPYSLLGTTAERARGYC